MIWRQKYGCAFVLGLLLIMSGCVSHVVYQPQGEVRYSPKDAGLTYEDVRLNAKDAVTLSGWWVPAEKDRGTVLFCHGNGGNISSCLDSILIANRLGLNMFIFDYRGYGKSDGSPTEQGTYLDAEAAWAYLVDIRKIPPYEIVVWGRSLGGAIAARTAAEHEPGALIVESAFTSIKDIVHDRADWVPSWFLKDYAYPTCEYLEKVTAPVLVIHGRDDEMIPFKHGRALYDSIRGTKNFVEIRGSHNRGYIESLEVYESSIHGFIDKNLRRKGEGL